MATRKMEDFSYRLDHSENMVVNTGYDYIKGIVAMLFGMRPGTDEYNPEMGLDLPGQRFTTGKNGTRDSAYESNIERQFSKYTDLVVLNPVAYRKDGQYLVSFTVQYQDKFYETAVGVDKNTLNVVIDSRGAGIKNL